MQKRRRPVPAEAARFRQILHYKQFFPSRLFGLSKVAHRKLGSVHRYLGTL